MLPDQNQPRHYLARFLFLCFLTAITIWITTHGLTHWILYSPNSLTTYLHANRESRTQLHLSFIITQIEATVNRRHNLAEIRLTLQHPSLREIEIELPLVNSAEIELALSKKLKLSRRIIRPLMRYRFEN